MPEPRESPALKARHLPRGPGVYLFKDEKGRVIYVGKALDLRARVRSYFQKGPHPSPRLRMLVQNIADLSYIVTDSEDEAFLLESNLIKEHSPRYNVRFRDDKAYPYLCLTTDETYPRLEVARRVEEKGRRYFGPYSNAGAMRETMRLIKKIFPLRSCRQPLDEGGGRTRPCLNFQIGRCLAPCRGELCAGEYGAVVEQVILFLEGRQNSLLQKTEKEMKAASDALLYEKAARLRDRYFSLQKVMERQKAVTADLKDRDIIALVPLSEGFTVGLFRVRRGRLLGAENFTPRGTADAGPGEVMKEFIRHYYDRDSFVPGEILLSHLPAEKELLLEWLKKKRPKAPPLLKVPQRGEKKALLELVKKNALLHDRQERERLASDELALDELARIAGLPESPRRIEGYDVSHFAGRETAGSMVVFQDGRPYKEGYRRFKIRSAPPNDDIAALVEMLKRRFAADSLPLPSLILVDGGKGQLAAARAVLVEKGLEHIALLALAKEQEHIFIPGEKRPLVLPSFNPALKLLQQVRDEAHRFAVSLSRELNLKSSLASFLEGVEGIGPVRRKALLKHYGGLEALHEASIEELRAIPGMNNSCARKLYRKLRGGK